MKILAIESSCDEMAAAIVDENFGVLSNEIFSSSQQAAETGGVIPELAAREAGKQVICVVQNAMKNFSWNDIDAIAVTNGPGLAGSLMVGIETAKSLAFVHQKPIIPVFHIFGHIAANLLERGKNSVQFPALVLTVSGKHNNLVLWENEISWKSIGKTKDDAAGECFDKCARMLGLSYPGGPALSKLAESGNPKKYIFPRPLKNSDCFDFSFSGLKTALFYFLREKENWNETEKADIAASVQEAIVDTLVSKASKAVEIFSPQEMHITGGVSANKQLRQKMSELAHKKNIPFKSPEKMIFCTDNAAMIGAAAHLLWKNFPEKKWQMEEVQLDFSSEK